MKTEILIKEILKDVVRNIRNTRNLNISIYPISKGAQVVIHPLKFRLIKRNLDLDIYIKHIYYVNQNFQSCLSIADPEFVSRLTNIFKEAVDNRWPEFIQLSK